MKNRFPLHCRCGGTGVDSDRDSRGYRRTGRAKSRASFAGHPGPWRSHVDTQKLQAPVKTLVDWGDVVNTNEGGRARVSLDDGSVLNVGSSSSLLVTQQQFRSATDANRIDLWAYAFAGGEAGQAERQV